MKAAFLPILAFVALLHAQEITTAADLCTISGQAINAATGEPLKAVRLTLADLEQKDNRDVYRALSDLEGRFSISAIAPGRYRFLARHNGFVPQMYQPDAHRSREAMLELTPGQKLDKVLFRLTPAGVIIGRITDEDGEPVSGVEVEALVEGGQAEREESAAVPQRDLASFKEAVTNDLGEYRLYGLPPGRYYLAAIDSGISESSESNLGGGIMLNWDNRPTSNHPPLYFPGVLQRGQAQKLKVVAGQEVRADLSLRTSKTVTVSGQVLGTDGQPASKAYVVLRSREIEAIFSLMRNVTSTDEHGTFTIKGVVPGAYTLQASRLQGQNRVFTEQQLEVSAGNISDLRIQLGRGLCIKGSISAMAGSKLDFQNLRVWLKSPQSDENVGIGEVKADGSFTVGELRTGTYVVFLTGLPDGWYLHSGLFGSIDVLEQGLWLSDSGPNQTLDLIIARGTAQIQGTVVKTGDPVPGVKIELLPERNNPYQPLSKKMSRTDQHGGFIFKNVVPGKYQLTVVEDDDESPQSEESGRIPLAIVAILLAPHESKTIQLEIKGQEL